MLHKIELNSLGTKLAFCFILKLKILLYRENPSIFYLLSFILICCTTRCHSLLFVVTRCNSHYHYSLLLVYYLFFICSLFKVDLHLTYKKVNESQQQNSLYIY